MNNRQVAWIIGASSGIGRALAIALARKGYALALSARSSQPLSDLLQELPNTGTHRALPCDVTDPSTLHQAHQELLTHFGRLDLMIYGAGLYTPMPLINFDLSEARSILETNLLGALNVFDVLKDQATAKNTPLHLLWISSVAGYRGLPTSCAYGISKAGLTHFAEIQRVELSHLNTKVQIATPGFVKTRLSDKNDYEMPMIITPEQAAQFIVRGLKSGKFNISFPPLFSIALKLFRVLPDWAYFWIAKRLIHGKYSQ